MSAKFLQALTDENPDLQRQIGCMTGIFQLFDRHHNLSGKRLNGKNHKRLPSGRSRVKIGNFGAEAITCSPQTETEKSLNKNPNENQRTAIESSRTSFSSSSCSSSFSSLDCNKATQPETPSFEKTTFSDRSLRNPQKSQNSDVDSRHNKYALCRDQTNSARSGWRSLDIRDIVKDSIYRETHGLSVKTPSRDESVNHVSKHRDSPRPMHLNESVRVLAKLQKAPWYFSEDRELSRSSCEAKDASLYPGSKDAPRFSYDGRELPRSSFDSRDTYKSTAKLRELPRLSLDSRERSMRSSNLDSKPSPIMKDLRRSTNSNQKNSNYGALNPQELGSYKQSPSVVAKLMGLEPLPNSQSKLTEESKQDRTSRSPRSSLKDPVSPQLKNPHSATKPSRSIETAPWRQQDSGRSTQKTSLRNREARVRSPSPQSVYIEIEKRLKEFGFQQSNKDLRALKQTLDPLQAKGLSETNKGKDQAFHILVQKNSSNHVKTVPGQNLRSANKRNPPNNHSISAPIKGNSSPRAFESPIVIMKPGKFIDRSSIPASSVIPFDDLSGLHKLRTVDFGNGKKVLVNNHVSKDTTPKLSPKEPANRILTRTEESSSPKPRSWSMQSSSRTQQLPIENSKSQAKSSGSLSPRMPPRKPESEKRSPPPIPLTDSSKPRRQSVRQQTELGSPGGKRRLRSTHVQPIDDQSTDISSETRNISHQGDEFSLQSDSNVTLTSQTDMEVTSAYRSSELNCVFFEQGGQSPSCKVANNAVSSLSHKSLSSFSEDGLSPEFTMVAPEQPSPVSVLDASFYRDDLPPSPVKTISSAFKDFSSDDETQNPDNIFDEDGWNLACLDRFFDQRQANFSSEINHKKLDNIEHLVQKLRPLSSSHNEATTDYIASLCENTSPDHRYISEILLASGPLLKDLASTRTPIQLHPSGQPINPNLFFVLEQTKANCPSKSEPKYGNVLQSKPDKEKLHRKLVFDSVNEILVRKLVFTCQSEPWLRPDKLMGTTPSGQQLLRELCSEIEQLRAYGSERSLDDDDDDWLGSLLRADVMCREESWTDFCREKSGMVLDIERLIFKDLVDDIVNGESLTQQARLSRRRRQLFAK
ncbi:protein LONGIFOLIA 1-like isoform X2 [Tasmannia lanceolata]|uniref:protein LONGIFOLIA 1-like isoform X2 n=1 Tax=Tasmannia lanceolata TaxID=3420 RepID=UPI0040631DD4